MKKHLITFLLSLSFIFGFSLLSFTSVSAADFSVTPNINNSLQIDGGEGYLNYDVEGMQNETLNTSFTIENLTKNKITVEPTIRNGLTSMDGTAYDSKKENAISGLTADKYKMDRIIKDVPEAIDLDANEKKTVHYVIDVPNNLQGKRIGGIGFTKQKNKIQDSKKDDNISIKVKSGYVFAVWLNGQDITKQKDLKLDKFDLNTEGTSPALSVHLVNHNSDFLNNQDIHYQVIDRSNDETLFENDDTVDVISPNNYLKYKIDWDGTVEDGQYTLNINDESYDFEITSDNVEEIAKKQDDDNVVKESSIPFWIWIVMAVLAAGILGFILFFIIKKRKDKKEEQESENESFEDAE